MPLRNATPITVKARTVTDTVDATNAQKGAMQSLSNLMPAPHTPGIWMPRPASLLQTSFGNIVSPEQGEALLVVGQIAYGMIASGNVGGLTNKSEPFAYNVATGVEETITGIIPAGLPNSQPTVGDWTPPTMAVVGERIIVTHPGFSGGNVIGWLDISGFTSNTVTGNVNSNTTITNLSSNVLQDGWNVGMTISAPSGNIAAGSVITSINPSGNVVVISKAALTTAGNITFTVAGGTATQPQWASGQTNGQPLAAVPDAVTQFNGRAYYAVNNGVQFSDSENATQITNASQALTFANGLPVTALAGLPLNSSTQGGIIQSVIAFQGDANMVQISGDPATNNLTANNLGVGVGTLAPNTICQTTRGLAFVAPDGLRIIDFFANVSNPIGQDGTGIIMAFLEAINSSRMAAAFNQDVMRISVQNGAAIGQPVQEYWYDFGRKIWSGPHTFPAALIEPYQGAAVGHGFLMFASGINAKLFSGTVTPGTEDTYTENGTALTFTYGTSLLPDNAEMAENAIVQSMLSCAIPSNQVLTVNVADEFNSVITSTTRSGSSQAATIWNSFVWGAAPWLGGMSAYSQVPLQWPIPIVFKQMSIKVTGSSASGLLLGNLALKYQKLGYLTEAS